MLQLCPILAVVAVCALAVQICSSGLLAQSGVPADVPETAPFNVEMLSSYDGQTVASVELAGRPNLNHADYASMLLQKPGQPFSASDVQKTAGSLKSKGKYAAVRIQIRSEAAGIKVVFVFEPAVYFGVFEFPVAARFSYLRLRIEGAHIWSWTRKKLLPFHQGVGVNQETVGLPFVNRSPGIYS